MTVHTVDPKLLAGETLDELADGGDLTDDTTNAIATDLGTLAQTPDDQGALSSLVSTLQGVLGGLIDSITDEAVVKVENGVLYVNISLKPINLIGGAIALSRDGEDENAHLGPIFAMQIPLKVDGTLSPATINNDILSSTKVHIEGYVEVFPLIEGYVKLLINQQGSKFFLQAEVMDIFYIFEFAGFVNVSKQNVVNVMGSLSSWFTEEWGERLAQLIKDLGKPFTDALKGAQDDLADAKAQCPGCSSCDDLWGCVGRPFTCAAGVICEETLNLAMQALGAVEQGIGAALEGAAWLVEKATSFLTEIFELHEATFDLTVDPNNPYENSCLDLTLDVTIFGNRIQKDLNICLDDITNEVMKIARSFAPGIFGELDSGNSYAQKALADGGVFACFVTPEGC